MDEVARTVLALVILILVAGLVPLVDGVRQPARRGRPPAAPSSS